MPVNAIPARTPKRGKAFTDLDPATSGFAVTDFCRASRGFRGRHTDFNRVEHVLNDHAPHLPASARCSKRG